MWGAKKPMIQEFSICPSQSLQSKFERRGLLCPRSLEESPGLLEHLSVRIVEIRPSSLNFMFPEMRISLPSNMDMKWAPKFGDQKNGCGTSARDPMRAWLQPAFIGAGSAQHWSYNPEMALKIPKVECQSTASIPLTPSYQGLHNWAQDGPQHAPPCTQVEPCFPLMLGNTFHMETFGWQTVFKLKT